MNKETRVAKKVAKRRLKRKEKLTTSRRRAMKYIKSVRKSKEAFREEHKKRAEMNKTNNANYRKQLCKLLNMSDIESHKYSTEALEALYDAKRNIEVTD